MFIGFGCVEVVGDREFFVKYGGRRYIRVFLDREEMEIVSEDSFLRTLVMEGEGKWERLSGVCRDFLFLRWERFKK